MKDFHKLTRWLAPAALALFIGGLGPLSAFAQASNQQPIQKTSAADLATLTETVPAIDAAPADPHPAPPPSSYSWAGVYIGGHVGHGWGRADTGFTPLPTAAQFINLAPITLRPNPTGLNGGGQVGYNWQSGRLVFGAEADLSASRMRGTITLTPITQNNGASWNGTLTAHQDTTWFGTLRGRIGVTPTPRVLIYGTAGLAYGHVKYAANSDFRPQGLVQYPASFAKNKTGWTAGFGVEVAFPGNHWSWKAEYLYYDLRKETFTANPVPVNSPFQVAYTWETKAHTFNTGINFRF
jgi:outer membrane immunogenic protein